MPSPQFYIQALRIRMIEEAIAFEYPKEEMRCPTHLSIGQEANAVAIAECLTKDDFMVSTHRGHAHYLAKGGSLEGLIGELYGKPIGCARGRGGSMHCVDVSCGFLGATSIVGGTVPIGVGAAFASKLKGENRLTVVCIGDAAIEEGVFHESANFASLHKLPVIFFMENNLYSCFTPLKDRQPKRKAGFKAIADAHGMSYFKINAETLFKDTLNLKNSINALRSDSQFWPLFIECDAYRYVEHCGPKSDDHLNYRPQEELLRFTMLDPIKVLKKDLFDSWLMTDIQHDRIVTNICAEIKVSFERVRAAPIPLRNELGHYLYA